ncbi:MAG: hypothetical protein COT91_00145 [Candidatus Doudnabacteria bacterium CG10_big_fil_rev_8_21_14_0_10_41_10]|uniref:Transcriptional repressor PaaX-like central Cas2-like domain-containing protein n=1 Tax=Candidatus Doudnabacteria bacterium CG10_big_fil_rev_8_21_14_0_10_41_10 TaxID=1974551 RepID=A0A2H0VH62_9BACT|nr:MAG: hypothetical protein COT91_00145 [Candidatus Doudnabacteria bacterium CG10_big_fil_rev_8_21_14_0_10_41_10]
MFDIPESSRGARDFIRRKLLGLGFATVHKSIYISPYPCEEAVNFLRNSYSLAPGQLYIFESKVLEGEKVLRKYFKL